MPFISVKLDAKESKIAPEGRYPLRVIKVDERKTGPKSKNPGETYYAVMIANESPEGTSAPSSGTACCLDPIWKRMSSA